MHALEKEMATHSSVLAWRVSWTGEPGGLPSMQSHSWTRLKQLSSSSSILSGIHAVTSVLEFSVIIPSNVFLPFPWFISGIPTRLVLKPVTLFSMSILHSKLIPQQECPIHDSVCPGYSSPSSQVLITLFFNARIFKIFIFTYCFMTPLSFL